MLLSSLLIFQSFWAVRIRCKSHVLLLFYKIKNELRFNLNQIKLFKPFAIGMELPFPNTLYRFESELWFSILILTILLSGVELFLNVKPESEKNNLLKYFKINQNKRFENMLLKMTTQSLKFSILLPNGISDLYHSPNIDVWSILISFSIKLWTWTCLPLS